jgi:hypothetical protein
MGGRDGTEGRCLKIARAELHGSSIADSILGKSAARSVKSRTVQVIIEPMTVRPVHAGFRVLQHSRSCDCPSTPERGRAVAHDARFYRPHDRAALGNGSGIARRLSRRPGSCLGSLRPDNYTRQASTSAELAVTPDTAVGLPLLGACMKRRSPHQPPCDIRRL